MPRACTGALVNYDQNVSKVELNQDIMCIRPCMQADELERRAMLLRQVPRSMILT
jgi:hypothetical protein